MLAVLFVGKSKEITAVRLRWALIAAAAVSTLKAPLLSGAAGSFFFAVALGYADLVVVTPLAALAVLVFARRRKITRAVRGAAWVGVTVLPALGVYATYIEPRRLVEERVDVTVDPRRAPSEPMRIAVLADLQSRAVDEHLRNAVRTAMAFEPHLIVLPGDLIQLDVGYEAVVPEFRELLRPLAAPLGVYFVIGNTDDAERVSRVFEGTNVTLLENQSVETAFGGRRVVIGGAGFSLGARSTRDFLARFDTREADELRILVAHYPDALLGLDHRPAIDLAIAGHTHGGQVQLPFFGPPLTLSAVPRHVGAGGLHELEGRQLYVSRGVGAERGAAPQLRFLCAPEVSLLTVRSAENL